MKSKLALLLSGFLILFAMTSPIGAQPVVDGTWRGFMGVPNGEEFGFTLDVVKKSDGTEGVLTPGPVSGEKFDVSRLNVTDDVVSFSWFPGSFVVNCTFEAEGDGTYFGTCMEPSGLPGPAVIAPPGVQVTKASLSWERVRDLSEKAQARELLDQIESPRGKKIDAGGYGVYALADGAGAPTVVFVSGLGDDLRTWDYVHYGVQQFTTALSYSRSGIGHSDESPDARTPTTAAEELSRLLEAADVPSPYVLVGHGLGSIFVRAYAQSYPSTVGGIVLLDPVHELEGERYAELDAPSWRSYLDGQETLYGMAPNAVADEFSLFRELVENGGLEGVGELPDVPTIVITSSKRPERERWVGDTAEGLRVKYELHGEMLNGLTWSRHLSAGKSAGYIQREEPDLVVDAIRDVVDVIEQGPSGAN